ncbi:DUF2628 domain-containing protein [Aureimonas psammosilenae]|uniref:DUF2628 domain-containing protein n=1 Tax=Aureimonas psammosilenae TaxID=2495496 RepID=UPI001260F4BD|nr:DUF2628 domain-containing protein [Aureimonas psammosilenae]
MTRYVVFEPPRTDGAPPGTPSERAVFVRDGFSVWAFLFPWLWLLRYGLFLSALIVFLVSGGLGWLGAQGYSALAVPLALLLALLVALEGPSLRGLRFRRKHYAETGAFQAANAGEAAIFYYAGARSLASTASGGDAGAHHLPWRFAARPNAAEAKRGGWRNWTGAGRLG